MTVASWIGRWTPGIGDPSVGGWVTVAAYLLTAWLCWRARAMARRENEAGATHQSARLWTAFSVGLLALGINKQLDLQSAVTELGRIIVDAQGWRAHQRQLQVAFIVCVLFVVAAAFLWATVAARRDLRRTFLALLGGAELGAFVAIRAASFHAVDRFIGFRWAGIPMNWVMELGGIGLIALCALLYANHHRRSVSATR